MGRHRLERPRQRIEWDRDAWFDLTGGAHEIGETQFSGVRTLGVLGKDVFAGGTFSSVGKQ